MLKLAKNIGNFQQEISNLVNPEKSGYLLFRLQTASIGILNKVGLNPWFKLYLPYGLKCLYNASEQIDGSISDVFFEKEYYLLDNYEVSKGDIVVDVGAFVGLYSILSAKLAGRNGLVISIEPEPHSFCLLTNNMKLNNLKVNTVQLNMALSDENGKITLYVPKFSSGSTVHLDHLLSQTITEYTKAGVETRTCDYLLKSLKVDHVDIMKIDVEGAEISVLRGASYALKNRFIDKLVIEVHKTINSPEMVMAYLKSKGYITDAYIDINARKGMLYAFPKN